MSERDAKYKMMELLNSACTKGDPVAVELLLRSGVIPDQECFYQAVAYNRTRVIEGLLRDSRIDPSGADNYALKVFASRSDLKTCSLLLEDKRVDPSVLEDDWMYTSVRKQLSLE